MPTTTTENIVQRQLRIAKLLEDQVRLESDLRDQVTIDPDQFDPDPNQRPTTRPMAHHASSVIDELDGWLEHECVDAEWDWDGPNTGLTRRHGLEALANARNMLPISRSAFDQQALSLHELWTNQLEDDERAAWLDHEIDQFIDPTTPDWLPATFQEIATQRLIDEAWTTLRSRGHEPWTPAGNHRATVTVENPYAHPEASWLPVGARGGDAELVIKALFARSNDQWFVVKCFRETLGHMVLYTTYRNELQIIQWEGERWEPKSRLTGSQTWLRPIEYLPVYLPTFHAGDEAAVLAKRWHDQLQEEHRLVPAGSGNFAADAFESGRYSPDLFDGLMDS